MTTVAELPRERTALPANPAPPGDAGEEQYTDGKGDVGFAQTRCSGSSCRSRNSSRRLGRFVGRHLVPVTMGGAVMAGAISWFVCLRSDERRVERRSEAVDVVLGQG
jgi:hypothetical protein